jgi:DNA (cytosine-5)-methyltransferase 1
VNDNLRQLTYLDFFAGAGLVRAALEPDWRCLWANDIDLRKKLVFDANSNNEMKLDRRDVADVRVDDLPVAADMAWASFPCQDLSLAGWRKGMSAERSGTFWAFWKLMRDLFDQGRRPPLIVIENVTGILYGPAFSGLSEALAALGLRFGALVIDAVRFVPQSRPRVFIVAADAGLDLHQFTLPSPAKAWHPRSAVAAWLRLSDDLRLDWLWWGLPEPEPLAAVADALIDDDAPAVAWDEAERTQSLIGMMSPANLAKVERVRKAGGRAVGFLYRRTRSGCQRAEVRFDGVAGCLRTPEGGSSRQTVVVISEGRVRTRLLSPREAARLMGLRDSFWLPPRYNDAYRAVGDGVAVPAVHWLSQHLLVPLARHARTGRGSARLRLCDNAAVYRRNAENRVQEWEDSRR